jgi:hypothetical protein
VALVLVGLVLTVFIALFFLPVVCVAISIAYRWILLSRYGATLGMMLAALRAAPSRWPPARPGGLLHACHDLSLGMFFVVPQIVSIALMF